MEIRELSREECLRVLARAWLAKVACAHENQPYVVPVYLAYDEESGCLYGFTTAGQMVEWMRANPLVCVEVDEIAAYDQWVTVIATGRFEELAVIPAGDDVHLRSPERPQEADEAMPTRSADSTPRECYDERARALQVLQTHPLWWEPGATAWKDRAHRDTAEPFHAVYYKIRIDRVTGHEASIDAPPSRRWGWLRRALTRVFDVKSKEARSAF